MPNSSIEFLMDEYDVSEDEAEVAWQQAKQRVANSEEKSPSDFDRQDWGLVMKIAKQDLEDGEGSDNPPPEEVSIADSTKVEQTKFSCEATDEGEEFFNSLWNERFEEDGDWSDVQQLAQENGLKHVGSGLTRIVFKVNNDSLVTGGNCILKVSRSFQPERSIKGNMGEAAEWVDAQQGGYDHLLAPATDWDDQRARWLLMPEVDVEASVSEQELSELQDKFHDLGYHVKDLKAENVGYLDGKLVVVDYAEDIDPYYESEDQQGLLENLINRVLHCPELEMKDAIVEYASRTADNETVFEMTGNDVLRKNERDSDFLNLHARVNELRWAEFVKMDSPVTIFVRCDSGTDSPGPSYFERIKMPAFAEQMASMNEFDRDRVRQLIKDSVFQGDVELFCDSDDPSQQYWGFNYILTQNNAKWGQGENRSPDERNPNLERATCKHLHYVLDSLKKNKDGLLDDVVDGVEKKWNAGRYTPGSLRDVGLL